MPTTTSVLTRSQAVLTHRDEQTVADAHLVRFDGLQVDMVLDRKPWEDMGKPSKITVTIDPGDKLNG